MAQTRPPLYWGYILLCAVLAAVIAIGLIYVGLLILKQNPGDIVSKICPPRPPSGNIVADIIIAIIVCLLAFTAWIIIIYFPLSAIISAILIQFFVKQRRLLHTILSVIISLPIAYGLLWLISKITS